MIFTERQITVCKGKSSIDEPVILYRGDYEVSIKFTIMESKFRFKSGVNLVDSEKASHGQLAILAPYGGNVFSNVVKCEDGTVSFTLTKEMIDQLEEVGLYSFQIRLFDYYRESRVSIPPVEFGMEVREPVASEDHDNTVNEAIVGYSIAKIADALNEEVPDTFNSNGDYNKTIWETGDRITEGKLNKIEDAIDTINKNEINDKNFLNKQMTSNFNVLQNEIDNLVLESGESDLEVIQARGNETTLNNRLNKMENISKEIISQTSNLADNVNEALCEVENNIAVLKTVGTKTPMVVNANSIRLSNIKDNTLLEYSIRNNNVDSKIHIKKIQIVGRNLFNKDTITSGKYADHIDGVIKSASTQTVSDFIELHDEEKIAFGSVHGVKFSRIVFYDHSKSFISGVFISNLTSVNISVIPPNAKYARVSADINTSTADTWQVEYGEEIGVYTSYYSDEFTFDGEVSLTSLSAFGSDILYSDGNITVKYSEAILDDSLHWYEGNGNINCCMFYLTNWCDPNNALSGTANSGIATNDDGYFYIGVSDGLSRGINLLNNGNLVLFIDRTLIDDSSGDNSFAKFKTYISNNPITLTYKTKNDVTKKVKIKEFLTSDGMTINIKTDLPPNVEYLLKKKENETIKKDHIQLEKAGSIHKGDNYYTSFGGGIMVNGKEYHIFRSAPAHTTRNGDYGCIIAYIKDRANNWTTKKINNFGLTDGEFRDINLSLPYDGSNDIILSGAFYTGVGYNYKNYVFRLDEHLNVKWFEEMLGSEGLFSWGNYLFGPDGSALKCAYDQDFGGTNQGVFLLRRNDNNVYDKIMLFPPSTVNPNECTIGYHGDKLICIVRQRADVSLYRETYDLSGATGWSEPIRLPFKAHAPNIPCYTPKDKPLIFTFSSVTDELVSQTARYHRDVSISATFNGIEWHKEKIMVENNHYGGYNTFVKNGNGYGMCYYDDYDETTANYKKGTDLYYKQIYVEQYLTELDYLEWKYKNDIR